MSKKVELTMYTSEECPDLYFDSKEDADLFDEEIVKYLKDPEALKDWDRVERQYPSYGAINLAIQQGRFHFSLGDPSDNMIAALENCIDSTDDADIYTIACNYIFYKIHPNLIGKL